MSLLCLDNSRDLLDGASWWNLLVDFLVCPSFENVNRLKFSCGLVNFELCMSKLVTHGSSTLGAVAAGNTRHN